jgi:hypothetical protein
MQQLPPSGPCLCQSAQGPKNTVWKLLHASHDHLIPGKARHRLYLYMPMTCKWMQRCSIVLQRHADCSKHRVLRSAHLFLSCLPHMMSSKEAEQLWRMTEPLCGSCCMSCHVNSQFMKCRLSGHAFQHACGSAGCSQQAPHVACHTAVPVPPTTQEVQSVTEQLCSRH